MRAQRRHHWDKHAIKAEINRRGETLTSIALRAGISPVACRVVFIKPIPAAERAISKFLSVPLHDMWPDRYDHNGNRLPSHSNPSKSTQVRTSKKGRAA